MQSLQCPSVVGGSFRAIGPVTASSLFSHRSTTRTLILALEIFPANSTAFAHASENSSLAVKVGWCVQLGNLALVHNADAVVVDDSLQSVSDTQERLALEAVLHTGLNQSIGLHRVSIFPFKAGGR